MFNGPVHPPPRSPAIIIRAPENRALHQLTLPSSRGAVLLVLNEKGKDAKEVREALKPRKRTKEEWRELLLKITSRNASMASFDKTLKEVLNKGGTAAIQGALEIIKDPKLEEFQRASVAHIVGNIVVSRSDFAQFEREILDSAKNPSIAISIRSGLFGISKLSVEEVTKVYETLAREPMEEARAFALLTRHNERVGNQRTIFPAVVSKNTPIPVLEAIGDGAATMMPHSLLLMKDWIEPIEREIKENVSIDMDRAALQMRILFLQGGIEGGVNSALRILTSDLLTEEQKLIILDRALLQTKNPSPLGQSLRVKLLLGLLDVYPPDSILFTRALYLTREMNGNFAEKTTLADRMVSIIESTPIEPDPVQDKSEKALKMWQKRYLRNLEEAYATLSYLITDPAARLTPVLVLGRRMADPKASSAEKGKTVALFFPVVASFPELQRNQLSIYFARGFEKQMEGYLSTQKPTEAQRSLLLDIAKIGGNAPSPRFIEQLERGLDINDSELEIAITISLLQSNAAGILPRAFKLAQSNRSVRNELASFADRHNDSVLKGKLKELPSL